MIFINFKTYKEGTGTTAFNLAQIIEKISATTQIKLVPVVQTVDLRETVKSSHLEIWNQKVDPIGYGAHTGYTLPEAVKEAGAGGTFLNHSENKFTNFSELEMGVARASQVGLKTLVFASDLNELQKVLSLKPTFVAYEPPELIGSKDKSVASEKPEIISEAFKLTESHGIPLIVGAGVHSSQDIKLSLKLGATGFAVASDILKAEDPSVELLDLISGFN